MIEKGGLQKRDNDNGREGGGRAIIQRNRFTNRGSEGIEELQAGWNKSPNDDNDDDDDGHDNYSLFSPLGFQHEISNNGGSAPRYRRSLKASLAIKKESRW